MLYKNNNIDKNLCVEEPPICDEKKPYLKIKTNECVKKCNLSDFFNHECINKNPSFKEQINNINHIINEIQNTTIDIFLLNNKSDIIIIEKNIIYQITSSFNQNENIYKNNKISNIIVGECEKILKDFL